MLAAVLATLIPTVVYTLLLWWLDRYEKEPLFLLVITFFWGSLPAIALALLIEFVLRLPVTQTALGPDVVSRGLAPLVEELAKALALVGLLLFARHEFDGPLDGIVYGALVGFGFAMTENLLFALSNHEARELLWVRTVLFGFTHAFFSSLVGLALGSARYLGQRSHLLAFLAGLTVATLFHSLHNIAAEYQLPGLLVAWLINIGGVLTVLLVAVLAWRHERHWMLHELPAEIACGTISDHEFCEVISVSQRLRRQIAALSSGGWTRYTVVYRLHHQITELALCLHQARLGDTSGNDQRRDQLRQAIAETRRQLSLRQANEPT